MSANCCIGEEDAPDTPDKAWLEAYRSLKHGVVRSACTHPDINRFPDRVQSLARSIGFLQNARHSIDYHPRTRVDIGISRFCVPMARKCIKGINELPKKDRIAFSAWIAFERTGGVADARKRAKSSDPDALDFQ